MFQNQHLTNKIKPTITQMYTHFMQLYIAGNFSNLTDVVRISGREWVPTHSSHYLNLSQLNQLYTMLAKQQTVWNTDDLISYVPTLGTSM